MFGLIGGPLAGAVALFALPSDYMTGAGEREVLVFAARATLALTLWMAVWWMTEAIDLSATAFLPLVALPLSGAASIEEAATPYASQIVFLMMGSFILALSMQRWGLDRRIALVTLRLVGDRPVNMVGGVMLATAMMGGFVSNTAKAAMLLPVGLSLIQVLNSRNADAGSSPREATNFAVCIMSAWVTSCV